MTNKRFNVIVDNMEVSIKDNESELMEYPFSLACESIDDFDSLIHECLEMVGLLNNLHQENKQLKHYKLYEDNKRLQTIIADLKEENEALKKFIKDNFNEMMDSKMVIDDEPFEFNKNCAKPYEIISVSPNGVIRVGKKNSKVSWRMKDIREINAELPPFEDFNREEYQKIKNKFAPKFGGGDLIGRIIYNIYNGTFEGLL